MYVVRAGSGHGLKVETKGVCAGFNKYCLIAFLGIQFSLLGILLKNGNLML